MASGRPAARAGVSPSKAVIKGRDGWLFYADDGAMADYAAAPPFTGAELERWRHTLQDTSDWLRAQGITYVFVIAPDKHVIYHEYMPETIRRTSISRIDELVSYLREHSTVRTRSAAGAPRGQAPRAPLPSH